MIILHALPFDIAEQIFNKLSGRDLAILTQVSRKVNALTTPLLYRTIHFRLPGFISNASRDDALLNRLETFASADFKQIRHTRRVVVSGTWYHEYDDLDSQLGRENLLSPAVRMLNTLLAVCLSKMPLLKDFIWDAQVAPTQVLISKLPLQPALKFLQLRLGTNETPSPYFRPTLRFDNYTTLLKLRLIQIDQKEGLRSIGNVLNSAQQLAVLTLWADVDAKLSLGTMFEKAYVTDALSLRLLDVRGFVEFNLPLQSLWQVFNPSALVDLTLDIGDFQRPEDFGPFWEATSRANVRVKRLATNRISTALVKYIGSFAGLEELHLLSCNVVQPAEPIQVFLRALVSRHATFLKILSIFPRGMENHEYLLDDKFLKYLTSACSRLTELAFGVKEDGSGQIDDALELPRLRVLHIIIDPRGENDERYAAVLRRRISLIVQRGGCPYLQYVAFDDGPVYLIDSNSLRWHKVSNHIARIPDTVLFRQPTFDWLDMV